MNATKDHELVESLGSTRRLQALTAVGWDVHHLRTATGMPSNVILTLLWDPPADIPLGLRNAVAAHYRRLITQPAQDTPSKATTAAIAALLGWACPGDWDDIDVDTKASHSKPAPAKTAIASTTATAASQPAIDELQRENIRLAKQVDRMGTEQRKTDRALAETTKAHDAAKAANTVQVRELAELNKLVGDAIRARDELHVQVTQLADDLATRTLEIGHLREQLDAVGELPGRAPRVGQLVVEQSNDGSTRVVFTSRKKAHITFAGVDVDVPALVGRIS